MNNIAKGIIIFSLLFICLASCTQFDKNKIVGEWKLVQTGNGVDNKEVKYGDNVIFTEDGKVLGEPGGIWRIEKKGKVFLLLGKAANEMEFSYELNDNKLVLKGLYSGKYYENTFIKLDK